MTGQSDQPDLGAALAQLLPRLAALEEPFLRAAGVSMWEYTILSGLVSDDAVSQVELSTRTRRDPTRLGRHLEDLESRGLVVRERSTDQRQRTVSLTKTGRSTYARLKKQIRAAEDELLAAHLSAAEAKRFREALAKLLS